MHADSPAGRRRWIDALLVLGLAFGLYHAALHGPVGFTLDDDTIVENDPRLDVHSPSDLWRLITDKYWGESFKSERLWRPVALTSFALDRALLGPGPRGFRWTSALAHALTSLLVLLLLRRLLLARRLALVGALLFAAHPVHAESVAGVVGRAEVLALLFACAGWLLHLWGREREASGWRRAWPYLLAGACFFLGFASKEIALTAPFVLVLMEVATRGGRPITPGRLSRWAGRAGPYLYYLAIVVGYFVCRGLVLSSATGGDASLFSTDSARTLGGLGFDARLTVAALLARDALGSLLVPAVTSAHYSLPYPEVDPLPPSLLSAGVVATGLLHLGLLALGSWLLTRRGATPRALGLVVWGFFLSLGPVSNLIPIGVVRADRLLYTPSLYVCLALAALAGVAFRKRKTTLALALGFVLLFYAWRLNTNVRCWTNDRLLWETSLNRFSEEEQPLSAARCHLALGHHKLNDPSDPNNLAAARPHFETAIRLFGTNTRFLRYAADARHGLAMTLQDSDPERALRLLYEALGFSAGSDRVAIGLSGLHVRMAQQTRDRRERTRHLRLAEQAARSGLRFAPHSYDLWLRQGAVLVYLDRDSEAEAAFTQAIDRRRAPWQAYVSRANLRLNGDAPNPAGAFEDYRKTSGILLSMGAPHLLSPEAQEKLQEALFMQGVLALKYGHTEEASACHKTLKALYPQNPELLEWERKLGEQRKERLPGGD